MESFSSHNPKDLPLTSQNWEREILVTIPRKQNQTRIVWENRKPTSIKGTVRKSRSVVPTPNWHLQAVPQVLSLSHSCHFQRNSQPSHRAKIRGGLQDLQKQTLSPSSNPTALSSFRTRGFLFSIVPPATGVRMSQPPAVTWLGPRRPFLRRMGSLGSWHKDTEPMATVLTAGSTK